MSILLTFLQTSPGIQVDQSLIFVYTEAFDNTQALGGSNITIQCVDNYKNIGGSLTIICTKNNTWTTFPNCVSTSTSTTTVTPVRCSVNQETWIFSNGYISDTSGLTVYNDGTATGNLEIDFL